MLSRTGRSFTSAVFGPLARLLVRLHVSANAVTVVGTVVVVALSVSLLPTGYLVAAAVLLGLCVFTDSLDGMVARLQGTASTWGAFLDSTLDRISDAAIFGGIAVWAMLQGYQVTAILAIIALALGAAVPYARARAESVGATAAVGIAERADRLIVVLLATFLVGLGLPPLIMTIALAVLVVASAVTVVQRMVHVYRQLSRDPAQP